ncbi:MAG TPA: alpha/beta hydrolase [Thermomicrobiales bacterium]|jgi:pimeloyl-ACP methyl ester carboxylesterase
MRPPPALAHVTLLDCTLAVWEWAGVGPTLFFVHANGFHGRCWEAAIELLPEYRCLAIDLRGHGQSEGGPPPADWRPFGEDVAATAGALGLRGALGIGHSIGGHALALAAALAPEAFGRLLLIDPTIFARERYRGARPGEHFVARRRARWDSVDAMIERFAGRPPYDGWEPRVLRDYCAYGLLPAPDGDGFVLACAPAFEGALYQVSSAEGSDIYPELALIAQPTLIVRAGAVEPGPGAGFAASPTTPDLVTRLAHARDHLDRDHSHFLPMESPARVAAYVRELLAADPAL